MSDKIENKINTAFSGVTPNILDKILSDIDNEKGGFIMTENNKKKSNFKKYIATAAALVILAGGVFAYTRFIGGENIVDSVIYLDVNPSVELDINKQDSVISVKATNDDAIKILGDMDLVGSDIDVAVNALVGSMLKNGYITNTSNSVLISVDNEDPTRNQELQTQLSSEIKNTLQANNIDPSLLSLEVKADIEEEKIAKDLGISIGKAELIEEIIEANPKYTPEMLAKLSINELKILIDSNADVQIGNNVTAQGTANESNYIGIDKAKNIALAHARVTTTTFVKSDIDYENGVMVYEIEFTSQNKEYDYDINAITGEIVKSDVEIDDDDTQAPVDQRNYIGAEKAESIAIKHSGATTQTVTKNILDSENGVMVYEIEFFDSKNEYDYNINATTGEILKSEVDVLDKYDYDDDDKYDDNDDDKYDDDNDDDDNDDDDDDNDDDDNDD